MKVKLIAIAKDEAAYLPYWIFHHLHFGFDAIEIHINRCQDNSASVLNKIVDKYPQVSYRSADWVDKCLPAIQVHMQNIVYAECYWRTKAEAEFSHLMFLDIDEFWTPRDFTSNIHQCLQGLPKATTVSFNWLNVLKEEKEFAKLAQQLVVEPSIAVKSVINLEADLSLIRQHLPEFIANEKFAGHILSDGRKFKHAIKDRQLLSRFERDIRFPFVILHRQFRTQMEYVSLLNRGRPQSHTLFKMNRPGYLHSAPNQQDMVFDEERYQQYCLSYEAFLAKLDITEALIQAQQFIYERFNHAIALLKKGPRYFRKEDVSGIRRIFSGVDDANIKHALVAFESQTFYKSCRNWIKKCLKG